MAKRKTADRARSAGQLLGDEPMVPVPVPKHLVPQVEALLSKPGSEVASGAVSIPRSIAGSAVELASNPDVLQGIVRKLMAGARGIVSDYKSDKDFVDDCVQAFLAASASALSQSRDGATGFDGLPDDVATQNARLVWSAMSRARLFCVRPEQFLSANLVADRFTTEVLAGQKWEAYSGRPVPDDEQKALVEAYMEHGTTWQFPDPLPFDSMFISYGRRFDIARSGLVLEGRVTQEMLDLFGGPDVLLFGHLLWWEGDQRHAFTCIAPNPGPDSRVNVEPMTPGFICAYDGEWTQPASLDPWILNMLVKSINEHKSVSQPWTQTLSQRMDRKKFGKKLKTVLPLPEPFYLVPMKDELIEPPEYRSNAKVPRPIEWSHRWDVRGHEVVRVQRGLLPLSPEDAARLKKRGYRVYSEGRVTDPEDQARTLKRGVRGPVPGEWMAVLSYWRDAFVKGPKDRPYIPGARV